MIDLEEEGARPSRAVLVGIAESPSLMGRAAVRELAGLVETAGLTPAEYVILTRYEPTPKFGLGSGKAEEISALAEAVDADHIVFDFEISPRQQRNWEELSGKNCIDRQELIIRIFADRARTREAVLQVELAKLEYSLPRLAHTYSALSRQRGGRYGTKGAGETQLELDRRGVLIRIGQIKEELKAVRQDRATQRKRRERVPVPSIAIVGYTNVGKSTLLNALTGAGVLSEDKLFATLDPTTRRFTLPNGRAVLLTDTVGFIKNLPHGLVDAFHATLEEAAFATAVIILLDGSDLDMDVQLQTTLEVLGEVEASDRPRLVVINKMDKCDEFTRARLEAAYPDAVRISATTRDGFAEFADRLSALLSGDERVWDIPPSRQELVARLHREGDVSEVEYLDDCVRVHGRASGRLEAMLKEFER